MELEIAGLEGDGSEDSGLLAGVLKPYLSSTAWTRGAAWSAVLQDALPSHKEEPE